MYIKPRFGMMKTLVLDQILKEIGAIDGQWGQKSSGNSAVIKKIILSDQTFSDPFRRDHSLILTPGS